MDTNQLRAAVLGLLDDAPITREEVRVDIRESVAAGEFALAFNTLCSWIYEDQLEIDRDFYLRLVELAETMDERVVAGRLSELVRG